MNKTTIHEWGVSGQITGINLSSFLQMMEMEQKTCTVNVLSKKKMGRIFFSNGVLVDAATAKLNHINALYEILSWENIIIEVEKNNARHQDKICLPLMHVLMEGARKKDEKRGVADSSLEDPDRFSVKPVSRKISDNRDFSLEIGVKLLVDFEHLPVTFRSHLVGIEKGRYLLLKAPETLDAVDKGLLESGDLTIKTLHKGTIYAFRSKLMSLIDQPSHLMFIAYPDMVEQHELRTHKRFKCSIVTQLEVNDKERGGVIENISKGGCLCVMESLADDKRLSGWLLNNTVPLRCCFPGSHGEVKFMGEVKNARKKAEEIAVGLQFVYPEETKTSRRIINDYIQLIEYSGENV